MRVCLITPPSDFLLDQRVFVSLGILKVGAVLEQAGFEVDHLDLTGVSNYEDVVRDYRGADTFAITATTPQVAAAVNVLNVLKERSAHVVLGGPHPTLVNAAARKGSDRAKVALSHLLQRFDCVVAGDGEKAIFEAIGYYGLLDADDPKSAMWQTSKDFTESPWPARHLVDIPSYHYEIDGRRALHMITQLGCPFECGFCGGRFSPMLRRIRTRPAANVVAEMLFLHERYGVTGINYFDDELNVNKAVVGLMEDIAATGIDWRLRGFVKAELFNAEQARAMFKAGFRWLLCGFESAHPRILRNINKKATLADNTNMLRTAHAAGLKVKALMSMGHPGESTETVNSTREWLLQEKPDDFDLTVITVYPGTPYYDSAVSLGDSLYRYEFNGDVLYSEDLDFNAGAGFYKGKPGEYKAFVWTDHLKREELVTMRDEVEHDVRSRLGIPYPQAAAALNFDHSMGQSIPSYILKGTNGNNKFHNASA